MEEKNTYFIANRIKAGDADAFHILFRMHYPSLLSFTEGFVKDREIAEDIVQNVFVRVWVYRSSIDETKPMRGYLFLICRREICRWFRKEVLLQRFVSGMDRETIDQLMIEESVDTMEIEQMKQIANEIIECMPAKRREVFVLSRRDGLSIDEIAQRLNISPRTANKHMQLALGYMRKQLKQEKNEK